MPSDPWCSCSWRPSSPRGLWRPLGHFFGATGNASAVTGAALAIGVAVALLQRLRPDRALLPSLGLGGLIATAASLATSLGLCGLLTLSGVAVAIASLARWLFPRVPSSLDGLSRRHKALTALYVVAVLASLTSVVRVSVFMGDPARVDMQVSKTPIVPSISTTTPIRHRSCSS